MPHHKTKQKLIELKGEISSSILIVGDLHTPLSITDITTRQKVNKEMEDWNNTINQLDLIDIYRTFYPTTVEHAFFSSTLGTFPKLDHNLGRK